MLAADIILQARVDVLEHQVASLTDALIAITESHKLLVATLTLSSIDRERNATIN